MSAVERPGTAEDPLAVGVDGCRSGWIAAIAYGRPPVAVLRTELRLFARAAELIEWRRQAGAEVPVGIDIPIGLPPTSRPRACDEQARRRLGARWMTVFAPPDRELLGLDFAAARELVRARRRAEPGGHHPIATHQTINIAAKVGEVDRLLTADPARAGWLVEVHPELSFRTLAGAELPGKRTPAGAAQRRRLLSTAFPDAQARLTAARWPRGAVARDDLLDAYAVLWSALRFAAGDHLELGDGGRDAHGLPARIVV